MLIYYEFIKMLEDANTLCDVKNYLKEHYIEILGSDYLDYMSNAFSNKFEFYCGSLEGLINNLF